MLPSVPAREERGTSGLRARRRRPLYRAALARVRATPASASIPTPPPPAPRVPRAVPHSASSSHAGAQGYGPSAGANRGRGLPARGRAPSLGAAARAVRKKTGGAARAASAWRPREMCGASRGELEGIGRSAAHSNGILFPAGRFGPPR